MDHIYQDPQVDNKRFNLHYGDLTDTSNLVRLLSDIRPDEVYNLGAQSHVAVSFESPEYTADVDGSGAPFVGGDPFSGMEKSCRFYQASTSELYGLVQEVPQKETTPSIHAPVRGRQALRVLDHGQLPRVLRHVCLQRYPLQPRVETPRRDLRDRKITREMSRVATGLKDCLYLGNLNALETGATPRTTSRCSG